MWKHEISNRSFYWKQWRYLALLPTCGQSPVDLSIDIEQSSSVVGALNSFIALGSRFVNWLCETLLICSFGFPKFSSSKFGQFLDPNLIHFSPFLSKVGQWGPRSPWWGPRFSWLVNQSDRGIVLFLKQHFLLEVYSKILQFMLDFRVYD